MSFITPSAQLTTDITIHDKSFTNEHNVPKEFAIMAAHWSMQYSGNPPRIGKLSTTTLIGPLRKAIYAVQNLVVEPSDVANLLASAKGTIMHEGMTQALRAHNSGYICEQRLEREFVGWKVSGEFDILTPDKQIKDLKFVSNYNLKKLAEDREKLQAEWDMHEMYENVPTYFKYVAQLSIYRTLLNDPEVKPYGSILFSLNNGSDMGKYTIDSEVTFPLFLNEEVESFITERINIIQAHLDAGTMPLCSDSERGYNAPEYKLERYYPNSSSTRTVPGSKFSNEADFRAFIMAKGKLGDSEVIKEAKYNLCNYCNFSSICDQM